MSKREPHSLSHTIQTFDPQQEYNVVWRKLPHWTQAGTLCFITWRTADSMPRDVVQRWINERNELLAREGVVIGNAGLGETGLHWRQAVEQLPQTIRHKLRNALTERFDGHLDACHGKCLLKRQELARMVSESLLKFDGDRYELTDFVIMPNHVHLLASFPDEESMLGQCAGWKRYTSRRINASTGNTGEFWQEDAFDHLIRSIEEFEHYRRYIKDNGPRARLNTDEYLWWSST